MAGSSSKKESGKTMDVINPIAKMIEDKKKIRQAIKDNKPLSSLEGINFVKPL